MSIPLTISLSSQETARLAEFADLLIPSVGEMPSAGDILLQRRDLARVLQARPDVVEPMKELLAVAGEPEELVKTLEATHPLWWHILTVVVAGAYYMNRDVRRLIGYPGQEGKVVTGNETIRLVSEGLLDPVVERGEIFRTI